MLLRVLLVLLICVLLAIAACGYLFYKYVKPQMEEQMKVPKDLETARVVTGEGDFRRAALLEDPNVGEISEIRNYRMGGENTVALVGSRGASFLGKDWQPRKTVQFTTPLFGGTVLVDIEGDGAPEFLSRGLGMREVSLMDQDGKVRWTYSGSWMGVADAAAGDVDGDGKSEVVVAHSGVGGIHLLSPAGQKLWERDDANVWHVEIMDTDGDGRGEVLHSNAGGNLVVRRATGDVAASYKPVAYFSRFTRTAWAGDPEPRHLLVCDQGIEIIAPNGQRVARLEAAIPGRFHDCTGTPVRFSARGSFYATLAHMLIWKRSVLYIHSAEGKLVYQEIFGEGCRALCAAPVAGGQALLVGCGSKVWLYTLAAKARSSARSKKSP